MNKYKIAYTSKFKKQRKLMIARGLNVADLDAVIAMLANGTPLSEKYCDHALQGTHSGYRDCHVRTDWVLIYKIYENVLTLLLCETGFHSDLFR
ncbi:MAG: type II toxin-antitoxin system YafQ family toxin [Coriobacteriales bacterium]|nr:type II toxin-antitoxin system YafQ family toxin [Coriobacteriales bacterium]